MFIFSVVTVSCVSILYEILRGHAAVHSLGRVQQGHADGDAGFGSDTIFTVRKFVQIHLLESVPCQDPLS